MPLGTGVGLGPGNIVLDGESARPFWGGPEFWGREYISAIDPSPRNLARLRILTLLTLPLLNISEL